MFEARSFLCLIELQAESNTNLEATLDVTSRLLHAHVKLEVIL